MAVRVPYQTVGLSLVAVLMAVVTAVGLGWAATGWLDGPWGMLPGGRLSGAVTACESVRWDDFAGVREIEVETQPARPRSITTWSVVLASELFIPADFLTPWKRWPHVVMKDPRIRLRLGGQVVECRAKRVDDAERVQQLRRAIAEKYDLQPDGRAASIDVWWFRVLPR